VAAPAVLGGPDIPAAVTPPWHLRPEDVRQGQLIGSGGFRAVYDGQYRGEACAIKIVPSHTREQQNAFLAEVDVMWRMRHRSIVRIIGAVPLQGQSYIVLELMQGRSMRDDPEKRVAAAQPLAQWPMRLVWLMDVASAAAYRHSQRIAHRVS
jgi:serine/threonine protein kinase